MTFKTEKMSFIAFSLISGVIGVLFLMFTSSAFQTEDDKSILWLFNIVGLIMIIISLLLFTYNSEVKINKYNSTITQETRFLFQNFSNKYFINQFVEVGIGILGAGGSAKGSVVTYQVVLIKKDKKILKLPGVIEDNYTATKLAQKLSNYINLPLSSKPKTVFFNKLL